MKKLDKPDGTQVLTRYVSIKVSEGKKPVRREDASRELANLLTGLFPVKVTGLTGFRLWL